MFSTLLLFKPGYFKGAPPTPSLCVHQDSSVWVCLHVYTRPDVCGTGDRRRQASSDFSSMVLPAVVCGGCLFALHAWPAWPEVGPCVQGLGALHAWP